MSFRRGTRYGNTSINELDPLRYGIDAAMFHPQWVFALVKPMSQKMSKAQFEEKANHIHGGRYDYSKFDVDGKRQADKSVIICPVHGEFLQSRGGHLSGRGCNSCRKTSADTLESFISKAKRIHVDRYDYSLAKYVSAHKKVTLICRDHGSFDVTPSNHVNNNVGCTECTGYSVHSMESFISLASSIHHDKYSYENFEVSGVSQHEPQPITCQIHGVFMQSRTNHLSGNGCPNCAIYGFDRCKSGFLYILMSCDMRYMKIGISNKPGLRLRQLKRATPFNFNVMDVIAGAGESVFKAESSLHKRFINAGMNGFDGATEWFFFENSVFAHAKKDLHESR